MMSTSRESRRDNRRGSRLGRALARARVLGLVCFLAAGMTVLSRGVAAAADDAARGGLATVDPADPARGGQTGRAGADVSAARQLVSESGADKSGRADHASGVADPKKEGLSGIASGTMATSDGGDVRWRIDDAGVLTVSGHGRTTQAGDDTPWAKYRENVLTHVRIQGDPGTEGIVPESTREWFKGSLDHGYDSKLVAFEATGLDMSACTDASRMFMYCSSLTSLDLSGWDTSSMTDMSYMFVACINLTSLDVSGFDTSQVTDMSGMFANCSYLSSLDVSGFDTSRVTDMSHIFNFCDHLTSLDVSGFDTSKVTDMSEMFSYCSSLTSLNLSGFDTSKATDMSGMFHYCRSLTSLDVSGFDTSQVTRMSDMFSFCSSLTSLDLSGFDTSNVTDLSYMFWNCSSLTSLDLSGFDTSQVTRMSDMFWDCSSLTSLDVSGFDTSNVADMSDMFSGCSSLSRIDLGARWVFKGDRSCDLPEAPSDEGHTGMWQAIGKGTEALPLGRVLTARELMNTYNGRTMADAYVWQPAFHIGYEANADDATGSTAPTKGGAGATVSVSACGFTRPGMRFTRWSTEPDGSGISYAPGDPFVLTARSQVLYAQWEAALPMTLVVRSLTDGDAPVAGAAYVLGSRDGDASSGVEAYTDPARTERASWPQRSGADGEMRLYGLVPGTYYLFGTEVPAGYRRPAISHVIAIDESGRASVDGQPVEGGTVRLALYFDKIPQSAGTGATTPPAAIAAAKTPDANATAKGASNAAASTGAPAAGSAPAKEVGSPRS